MAFPILPCQIINSQTLLQTLRTPHPFCHDLLFILPCGTVFISFTLAATAVPSLELLTPFYCRHFPLPQFPDRTWTLLAWTFLPRQLPSCLVGLPLFIIGGGGCVVSPLCGSQPCFLDSLPMYYLQWHSLPSFPVHMPLCHYYFKLVSWAAPSLVPSCLVDSWLVGDTLPLAVRLVLYSNIGHLVGTLGGRDRTSPCLPQGH